MKIHELIWPDDRINHIARHGVEPEEVEEVCSSRSLVQRAKALRYEPGVLRLGTDRDWSLPVLPRATIPRRQRLSGHSKTHDGERETTI